MKHKKILVVVGAVALTAALAGEMCIRDSGGAGRMDEQKKMKLYQQFLSRNDCYRAGRTITPRGVMVHSTGANNPNLRRYVPGNETIGRNTGGNHWDMPGVEARCV